MIDFPLGRGIVLPWKHNTTAVTYSIVLNSSRVIRVTWAGVGWAVVSESAATRDETAVWGCRLSNVVVLCYIRGEVSLLTCFK